MSARDEEFDAQLAERGDDRPGLDDLDDADAERLVTDLVAATGGYSAIFITAVIAVAVSAAAIIPVRKVR